MRTLGDAATGGDAHDRVSFHAQEIGSAGGRRSCSGWMVRPAFATAANRQVPLALRRGEHLGAGGLYISIVLSPHRTSDVSQAANLVGEPHAGHP